MENTIGDEVRREDIDGIMQMTQKNAGPENSGEDKKKVSEPAMLPENERKKKWDAGMSREEEIAVEREEIEYAIRT